MHPFTDQTGRTISLPDIPRRIVSLVPSQTELLFDLGLDKEVVGITRFCVHPPEWFYTKTRVGGTKKLHIEIIHQLQPDLVIANKEENVKEQIEYLASLYPVWVSDVNNLEDAYEMIEQIGLLTSKAIESSHLTEKIISAFAQLKTINNKPKTAYLIWNDPYMTVGGDTFIHSMLEAAGFENIFKNKQRYPEISAEDLKNTDCEVVLLSSEPFPFKQKHADKLEDELRNAGSSNTKIIFVDGEMFSWYGSRLQYAPSYFEELRKKISNWQ